jgi:hypothetical protein
MHTIFWLKPPVQVQSVNAKLKWFRDIGCLLDSDGFAQG